MIKRNTLLIVDDIEINREMLMYIFKEQYDILEAADGERAIELIEKYQDEIALIFLDLIMPKKSGLEVMEFMVEKKLMNELPVIMITGEATADSDAKAYEYGAADIIYKPFDARVVMRRSQNIIELYENRRNIEQQLAERTKELTESNEKLKNNSEFLINALSSVIEFRSLESGEHIRRVKYYTGILLKNLMELYPEYNLSDEDMELIVNASALHDLGKIAIPDSILLKPGKLTKSEFEEMKKHTIRGCEILENFKQDNNDLYRYCYDICRYHHERYDGRGYPDHLVGEDIPIWAQVVSIVDVYDALVSKRVYKDPYAFAEAEMMIVEGECGVFSPKILECFHAAKPQLRFAIEVEMTFADNDKTNFHSRTEVS
jgi:putative two-component system response regulator